MWIKEGWKRRRNDASNVNVFDGDYGAWYGGRDDETTRQSFELHCEKESIKVSKVNVHSWRHKKVTKSKYYKLQPTYNYHLLCIAGATAEDNDTRQKSSLWGNIQVKASNWLDGWSGGMVLKVNVLYWQWIMIL